MTHYFVNNLANNDSIELCLATNIHTLHTRSCFFRLFKNEYKQNKDKTNFSSFCDESCEKPIYIQNHINTPTKVKKTKK